MPVSKVLCPVTDQSVLKKWMRRAEREETALKTWAKLQAVTSSSHALPAFCLDCNEIYLVQSFLLPLVLWEHEGRCRQGKALPDEISQNWMWERALTLCVTWPQFCTAVSWTCQPLCVLRARIENSVCTGVLYRPWWTVFVLFFFIFFGVLVFVLFVLSLLICFSNFNPGSKLNK